MSEIDDRASQPGKLHALVIGVSSYEKATGDIGSVAGPAISAARFAQFLRSGEYSHPDWSVGSVCVLLSPLEEERPASVSISGGIDGPAERLTVEKEVTAWSKRCDDRPADVGVLYAAGHGTDRVLAGGRLLLEGFGDEPGGMSHALDVEFLIRGMATRAAHANFFFLDMCRNTIDEHVLESQGQGPVRGFAADDEERLRSTLKVFFGAAPGKEAWTLPETEVLDHGTVFSKALLASLRGYALGFDEHGRTGITANSLHDATATAVANEAGKLSREYGESIRGSTDGLGTPDDVLFHMPAEVDVELTIELDPAYIASAAEATLHRVHGDSVAFEASVPLDSYPPPPIPVKSGKLQLQVRNRRPPPPNVKGGEARWITPRFSHWRILVSVE